MPTWKIGEYRFYFKAGEPLKKHEPAHIHIRGTPHGKIQFWLEKPDKKSQQEITIKKMQGRVSPEEINEIKKLVIKHKDLFLAEWNKRKAKIENR
ncbi:DUF4160 domain-containing protein [endosymbiont GvMRE of Glomus versiforme]|uniref:DUF4160 domain-containing protein n=1 Tax=endosymbiont GvMRE of Glomus versiforme TaxID=2039283 RepID=UPI000ED2D563|nr:DUF4160 domain-containing protein [endosymbiont GvMRE of Glomus versiforme]RHZ35921.1 hypothetical protein GvMRE_Ic4g94 [endosymbiont GvMRE of Glomus versiforme]